jgi:hypothetical protein
MKLKIRNSIPQEATLVDDQGYDFEASVPTMLEQSLGLGHKTQKIQAEENLDFEWDNSLVKVNGYKKVSHQVLNYKNIFQTVHCLELN